KPIADACAALRPDDAKCDVASAAAALAKLVVDPLSLDATTTRLLVSPDGALSYAPFALLAPDREIAYVPSGTTYGVLLADRGLRGDGVLALGDPDYGARPAPDLVSSAEVRRDAMNLVPLPATAAEAKAVGTVVLVGKDATEAKLRESLATRPR